MALKALLLRKTIDDMTALLADLNQRMTSLSAQTAQLASREAELETAVGEAKTEEERSAVQELCDAFLAEQSEHRSAVDALQAEIDTATNDKTAAEEELRSLEESTPKAPAAQPGEPKTRKDDNYMTKSQRRAFGAMTMEQRSALIQRDDVQTFLADFRARFADGNAQRRSVSGADLLIPEVLLDVVRENIGEYSKLISKVRTVSVSGSARQPIMGTIPEAVWTEACAALNELYFTVGQVEVDGYKVGGYVAICNPTVEDDPTLLANIVSSMGAAIGISQDKAILFGTGVKMPLGIATRLAQTQKPSGYSDKAREWKDLHQSNVVTIPSGSATGITLYQQILQASANAKGNYSTGGLFWAMSRATLVKLQVEATNINAAGSIVSILNGTMPVVGGDIVVFDNDIVPDNTIIGGYGDLYLLAERAGTAVGYSDQPLYIQDQTVVKATARYDGLPVIPEGFVVIGIGAAPTTSVSFAPDVATPAVAALSGLTIGGLTLTPSFDANTAAYTATTSNATNSIAATPSVGCTAEIMLNGKKVQNGSALTWKPGENKVDITVFNGTLSKSYAVTVTKS